MIGTLKIQSTPTGGVLIRSRLWFATTVMIVALAIGLVHLIIVGRFYLVYGLIDYLPLIQGSIFSLLGVFLLSRFRWMRLETRIDHGYLGRWTQRRLLTGGSKTVEFALGNVTGMLVETKEKSNHSAVYLIVEREDPLLLVHVAHPMEPSVGKTAEALGVEVTNEWVAKDGTRHPIPDVTSVTQP